MDLPDGSWIKVQLDDESYDIGSNFDMATLVSGSADGNTVDHLIDSGADFVNDGVVVGDRVEETGGSNYAYVTAVAAQDLTLTADIFPNGNENYSIEKCRFVAPVAGYYQITGRVVYLTDVVDAKRYLVAIYKNGSNVSFAINHSGLASELSVTVSDILYLAATDYIELFARQRGGNDTCDIQSDESTTFMAVHLLSV